MYAQAGSELPDGNTRSYEAKLDGYRALRPSNSAGVTLWSRRITDSRRGSGDVAGDCAKLSLNTLIDGEVVAIDENGRSSFNALQQSRAHAHIQALAYDDVTQAFQSLRARHCS